MKVKESVNNIIYMEIWKLFQSSFGPEQSQPYVDKIIQSSELITNKLNSAGLLYDSDKLNNIQNKIIDITNKIIKKKGGK